MGTDGFKHLDPSACLRLLGLPEAASAAEIKRAYRRLARRFHPDTNSGDETARGRFVAISNAYRCLMKTARLVGKGKPVGTCCVCREFGETVVGLDGRIRCPDCALRPRERLLLPLPRFYVVRCLTAVLVLGVSVYFLVSAVWTGRIAHAAGGALAGLGALAILAATCLRVVYCIQPGEDRARREALRRKG